MLNYVIGLLSSNILFFEKENILRQMCPLNDLKCQTTIWKKILAGNPRTGHMFLYISSKLPGKGKGTFSSVSHMFIAILDSHFR